MSSLFFSSVGSSSLEGTGRTYLLEARVAGATAVAEVALVAADMPGGFLGPKDRLTATGAVLAMAWLLAAGGLLFGLRRAGDAALPWALSFFAVAAGVFVPVVTADPLIAGGVVLWHLTLFVMATVPRPDGSVARSRSEHVRRVRTERWRGRVGPAQRHLALVATVLTVAVVGYGLAGHPLAFIVCGALHLAALVLAWPFLRALLAARSRAPVAVGLLGLAAVVSLLVADFGVTLVFLVLAQLALLLILARDADLAREMVEVFFRRPSVLLASSFTVVILVGTLFLTFPAASAEGSTLSPLDALFTATSATCVTGLIVVDTPTAFSPFGHGVLLVLIQVGGLGIMVLSTYAMLLLGGNLGLRGEHALSQLLESQSSTAAYGLTRFIVISTLAVEALGALLLTLAFWRHGSDPGAAAWLGVFHSVSAFCNAGFALFSDSLVGLQGDSVVLGVVGTLIVLGGLGFVVLYALWRTNPWRQRPWRRSAGRRDGFSAALRGVSVQVRTVLVASGVLLVSGWLLFAVLEWQGSLMGLGFGDKASNALFQSVTLRTAGFNSVDFADLSPATRLVMLAFMFVGASPGSTGGGIKTTTLVVLLAATIAIARGPGVVRLFDREVPKSTVFRALSILIASAGIVATCLFLLLVFEPQPFEVLLFEAVSAVGTVGLSLGATAQLGPMGKVVIIVAMFIGRIGPLTLALVLGTAGEEARVRHARARVMVG